MIAHCIVLFFGLILKITFCRGDAFGFKGEKSLWNNWHLTQISDNGFSCCALENKKKLTCNIILIMYQNNVQREKSKVIHRQKYSQGENLHS